MDTIETDPPTNVPATEQEHELKDKPIPRDLYTLDHDEKTKNTPNEPSSTKAPNPHINAQQLLDKALEFLSTASNETLGACLVGLGATTYFVLGRVGLVLIGVAGGVILHATWEKPADGTARALEERRRKEVGLDVVQRVLKWRDVRDGSKSAEDDDDIPAKVGIYAGQKRDFAGFRPETKGALEELTDAVIRDYVKWWYSPILPTETSFPAACRQTLTAFLLGISQHMSRKRPADTFLDFLTHSSSTVTVFLNELATATSAAPTASVQDAIRIYLDMKPQSSLATIVDRHNQERKLDLVAEDILECYLDHKAYNCEPVRTFLQQMLAKVCIDMTITACSKPEFINGWIVYLLEEGETDFMKEIDAGVEGAVDEAPKDIKEQTDVVEAAADDVEVERKAQHKRNVSKAQEAMEDAMKEAQRLSQMIAEHDAQRVDEGPTSESAAVSEEDMRPKPASIVSDSNVDPPLAASVASVKTDMTESTTHGIYTPTSSQSQSDRDPHDSEKAESQRSSSEGPKHQPEEEPPPLPSRSFTSFDQLVQQQMPTALTGTPEPKKEVAPLTLHNASISIFDDSDPNDRRAMRVKPQNDYMIQVEPASSNHSGWMIFRKYADFENLHEILGRIAKISGAAVFADAHGQLPNWKGTTETRLRESLERYLVDAVRFQSLAESEGLKRFLEKDQAMSKSPGAKSGFGWPTPTAFETMGKGMLDALAKAPKEVAGGGKAIIGGVTGVLVGGKQKKPSISVPATGSPIPRRSSTAPTSTPKQSFDRSHSNLSLSTSMSRPSQDILRTPSPIVDTQPAPVPQMDSRPPSEPQTPSESKPPKKELSGTAVALGGDQFIQLPPLPSEIPDDYDSNIGIAPSTKPKVESSESTLPRASTSTFSSTTDLNTKDTPSHSNSNASSDPPPPDTKPKPAPTYPPLTEEEVRVSVDLLFAIISELYTLSGTSAWSLRRTLLNAAKTFLLRPGNPQLLSITSLLQTTALDANTSDAGIATHIRKIRANALPTEQELKEWPKEMTDAEKEDLRTKARRLMVERGMPSALTGVMGMQASREAMGRLFDALQVERVARGLVFGLMLQGLRAITQ
jgi:PXA domain/Sorting nexin C terminal